MKLFNHVFEARLRSRHNWSHFRIHKYEMHKHLVWGKLSIIYGQPHLREVHVCSACNEEIRRVGEDLLDWCEGCQSLEQPTEYITEEEYEKRHA